MSEEPRVLDATEPPQEPTWEGLAAQVRSGEVHPGLAPHVAHQLAMRGMVHAANALTTGAAVRQGQETLAARNATTEHAAPATPERARPNVSAEQISEAFAGGQHNIYKMTADERFDKSCLDKKIDPYEDIATPEYWRAFSEFGQERIVEIRQKAGDSLQLRTLELMVTTPEFLFAKGALHNPMHQHSKEGKRDLAVAIAFNERLRNLALTYPDLRTESVNNAMLSMAKTAIEDKGVRKFASRIANDTVRGAMYELGFGQLLEASGRGFRKGSSAEDGKGTDYAVIGRSGGEIHIDAKASLAKVREAGSEGAYAIRSDHRVTMFALLHDHEFGGKFFVSETLARERGQMLSQQIDMAERDLLGVA
jgi:phosphopantetheine adenylyltransferase